MTTCHAKMLILREVATGCIILPLIPVCLKMQQAWCFTDERCVRRHFALGFAE